MDLLRKYGGILAVILVIGILFLICVLVGIRASGRDLPSWKRATDGVQTQMYTAERFIKAIPHNSRLTP
ncbi:MAG: hypothetical protein MJ102_06045 [Clostridia bacterium]|nr:hypothetical protein [Clostridia bacterium]